MGSTPTTVSFWGAGRDGMIGRTIRTAASPPLTKQVTVKNGAPRGERLLCCPNFSGVSAQMAWSNRPGGSHPGATVFLASPRIVASLLSMTPRKSPCSFNLQYKQLLPVGLWRSTSSSRGTEDALDLSTNIARVLRCSWKACGMPEAYRDISQSALDRSPTRRSYARPHGL